MSHPLHSLTNYTLKSIGCGLSVFVYVACFCIGEFDLAGVLLKGLAVTASIDWKEAILRDISHCCDHRLHLEVSFSCVYIHRTYDVLVIIFAVCVRQISVII